MCEHCPGVRLDELHCPTCGTRFTDYALYKDSNPEDFTIDTVIGDIKRVDWRTFLRCPQGHKWSVKTIWRTTNQPGYPDRVQLDQYLGTS